MRQVNTASPLGITASGEAILLSVGLRGRGVAGCRPASGPARGSTRSLPFL